MANTEVTKLYEAYEQESLNKSSGKSVAPVVREVVEQLFEETDRETLLLSAVHKLVRKVMEDDEVQYSTVASAIKAQKSGYVLDEDENGRTIIKLAEETE
ncbi:MAG: hypothetical protein PHT97_10985 [Methanoculleus sp.]|uniref:hypothetical protein n=1 Tax=Methanoculleus sp. TaxID=90427 RepID=UPI002631C2B3|nr:hypothetical protein [Methanoculleus sp.]MDD2255264.1 hypothetical protein [Methanoculleus sp.]MDD4471666.1 hypothetical protein [Methanoculleus sp.]